MPVSVAVTIADPPAAPPGYALCSFDVRPLTAFSAPTPLAVFPGTTDGLEDAANATVRAALYGLRFVAVAWWGGASLDECPDGRERLVSVYDAAAGGWGEWEPDTRVTAPRVAPANINRNAGDWRPADPTTRRTNRRN